MKKVLVLFTIIFATIFLTDVYAQTGKITLKTDVWYYNEDGEETFFGAYLYKDSTLIKVEEFDEYNNYITFENLSPGLYTINIEKQDTVVQTLQNIVVKENTNTSVDLVVGNRTFCDECEDTTRTEFFEISSYLSYGSDFLDDDNIFATQQYRTGLLLHQNYLISKNLSVGLGAGYNYSQTYFNKDSSFTQVPGIKNERFSYFEISYIFFFRFSPYNMKKDPAKGLFIDAGMHYNFPMAFRHVYSVDKVRYMTARIHKYNDFSVIGRVGFQPVSLFAEYRLSDYVKHGFPQQPRLKVGLSFHVLTE